MEAWGGLGGSRRVPERSQGVPGAVPRLERVLERSMMVCLLGLLSTERLASEMSAVTRVMEILGTQRGQPRRGAPQIHPKPPGIPLSPHS